MSPRVQHLIAASGLGLRWGLGSLPHRAAENLPDADCDGLGPPKYLETVAEKANSLQKKGSKFLKKHAA